MVGAEVGFDESLGCVRSWKGRRGGRVKTYPCVVELCLNADVLALFFELGAKDLELGRL